jgi:hypothetical protein
VIRRPDSHPTLILALVLFLGAGAVSSPAQVPETAPEAAPDARPRIGQIRVEALDVFSPQEAAHGWLYRTANAVRFSTRPSVIREFLLFKEGDPYDPALLAETERNLRALPFLKYAAVAAGPEHDGVVDVGVVTQDAWTTEPGISFGGKGGATTYGFQLREKNFLGTGREVALVYDKGTERTTRTVAYIDPYIFGPYWKMDLSYSNNSDGAEQQLILTRPFVSFRDLRYYNLVGDHVLQNVQLYEPGGDVQARFRQRHLQVLAKYGWAIQAEDLYARRLYVGFEDLEDRFELLPDSPNPILPDDRKFRFVTGGISSEHSDFVKLNYVNRDARFEDFNLGRVVTGEVGVSPEAFGTERNTARLRLSASEGWRISPESLVMATLAYETRYDGAPENEIISGRLFYILKLTDWKPLQTFVSRLIVDWGWDLDKDVQFYADPDNGLRGYKLHAWAGDRRIVFNAEQRFFSGREYFQLFGVGAAVFFDTGYAAPPGQPFTIGDMKSDVGVGLRIAITRAATNSIIRLDVAYPMNADAHGRRGFLFTFSSGQVF